MGDKALCPMADILDSKHFAAPTKNIEEVIGVPNNPYRAFNVSGSNHSGISW